MKKLSVVALALAAAMLFAVPAMAVDMDLSGHYRVRGFYNDNTDLNDDEGASDAALDMRLRLEPVIKVHDNLKLTMRFDGHDNRAWGDNSGIDSGTSTTGAPTSEDIGLERVYLDATFDMIGIRVGRMSAGTCGLKFCDSDTEQDRIKVILRNIDPFYLDYTYAKAIEDDYNSGTSTDTADEDFDAHWLHGFFSDETMTTGLLFGYYNNRTGSDADLYNSTFYLFDPYFKGTFGPFAIEAEAQWWTGDWREYDSAAGLDDVDYDAMRYIVDGAFNFGPGSVGLGYAHADGQDEDDEDWTVPGDGLGGNDWEPLLILTSATGNSGLGGTRGGITLTNFNSDNSNLTTDQLGFDIFYVYGSFVPMEKLTLTAIVGMASAAETPDGYDDEIGTEFDLGAKYQLMDNLNYDVKFGFLSAGDLYKGTSADDFQVDDTWAIMHSLVLTF